MFNALPHVQRFHPLIHFGDGAHSMSTVYCSMEFSRCAESIIAGVDGDARNQFYVAVASQIGDV